MLEGRVRCTSLHRSCGCSGRTPTAWEASPAGDGGPHDLPGWAYGGPTYSQCTPELLVGPWPGVPEHLGHISGDSETLVAADYPQRAAPIRQPTLPLTGVPTYSTYSTRSADTEMDFHQRVHPARRRSTVQR
ncbi:hypothetical protein NDU88_001984 [Pleurodeles waltl]|uniref:Uncharacterized protein n=1 Tax=Pleurodeles waltl TaxID=8319 RepID=A0AAV7QBN4_PLEWA|nr:hypothetical protein NDU88_001984 [Pleurodeles waltl]